jgi:hypothetical protein
MAALFATPPVANAVAAAALATAYGPPSARLTPQSRVVQAGKRLRAAVNAHGLGLISDAELGEQATFEHGCKARAQPPGVPIPEVPAWFGPAMAVTLAPVNATLATIDAQLVIIDAKLVTIDARLANVTARQRNRVALLAGDPLVALHNAEGLAAPHFPETLGQLDHLTPAQLRGLLQHYGLPVGPANTQVVRFKQFIGIRP